MILISYDFFFSLQHFRTTFITSIISLHNVSRSLILQDCFPPALLQATFCPLSCTQCYYTLQWCVSITDPHSPRIDNATIGHATTNAQHTSTKWNFNISGSGRLLGISHYGSVVIVIRLSVPWIITMSYSRWSIRKWKHLHLICSTSKLILNITYENLIL